MAFSNDVDQRKKSRFHRRLRRLVPKDIGKTTPRASDPVTSENGRVEARLIESALSLTLRRPCLAADLDFRAFPSFEAETDPPRAGQ